MPTNIATFINDLQRLEIDEVQTRLEAPPQSLPTGNLPASWVDLPTATEGMVTMKTFGMWAEVVVDLIVALTPMDQATADVNYEDSVRMMDNVRKALRALTPGTDLGVAAVSWDMAVERLPVGDLVYWAVVTTVTGRVKYG